MITAPGHVLGSAGRDAVVESCALAWHNHQPQLGPGWKRLAHERLTAPSTTKNASSQRASASGKGRLRFEEPVQLSAARPGERTARAGLYLMKDAI